MEQNKNKQKFGFADLLGEMSKKIKMRTLIIILAAVSAVVLFIGVYFSLIAFNINNVALRFYLVLMLIIWSLPMFYKIGENKVKNTSTTRQAFASTKNGWKVPIFVAAVLTVLFLALSLFTTPLFIAKSYYSLITVDSDMTFEEGIIDYDDMLVATVDKAYAKVEGDKLLGGEHNLGSQFEVNDYTMLYIPFDGVDQSDPNLTDKQKGDIYWVGALEYSGFFKWTSNSSTGSPGYIKISATDIAKKELVLKDMKYVPSAYFHQDMERKMYMSFPGKYRAGRLSFEIDNTGHPYYIQAVFENKFAFTSGEDTVGIIVLDAVTGECEYYDNTEAPDWIDHVFPTEVINKQLDYYGTYGNGFWNTLFAKKSMTVVTGGYNYLYQNGSFSLITGMTSISSDESLVGMVLTNLRTKETNIYNVTGATEAAAMRSASGKIQEMDYTATYPTLINYKGEPTYFMTLKDKAGTVKQYAFVNVNQFSKVVTGETIEAAKEAYNEVMGFDNDDPIGNVEELVVKDIRSSIINGKDTVQLLFEGKGIIEVFTADASLHPYIKFLKAGDKVRITHGEGNVITKIDVLEINGVPLPQA